MVDIIAERKDLKATLIKIRSFLAAREQTDKAS
jgi:hypothetical protein